MIVVITCHAIHYKWIVLFICVTSTLVLHFSKSRPSRQSKLRLVSATHYSLLINIVRPRSRLVLVLAVAPLLQDCGEKRTLKKVVAEPSGLEAVQEYWPRSEEDRAAKTSEEEILPSWKPTMMMVRDWEVLMRLKVSLLSLAQVMVGTGTADTWQVRLAGWPRCLYRTTGKLKFTFYIPIQYNLCTSP